MTPARATLTVGLALVVAMSVGVGMTMGRWPLRETSERVDLTPLPVERFESAVGVTVTRPPQPSALCAVQGPGQVVHAARTLAVGGCAKTPDELPLPAPRVLAAHLVGVSGDQAGKPAAATLPPLIWVVVVRSGREAIGDYFTSIYDGRTGALVLNVVIYVPPPSLPLTPSPPPSG